MRKSWFLLVMLLALSVTLNAGVREPVGLWTFEASDPNAATVGAALALTGSVDVISGVDGSDGAILIEEGSYYTLTHGIAPNGDGEKVNEYTILIDFKYPPSSLTEGYNDLIQTDPERTPGDDSDWTINNTGAIGIGAVGYTSASGYVTGPDTWYRMVLVVDNGLRQDLYMDGHRVLIGNPQAIDGRFSLAETLLLFCCGTDAQGVPDGDDGTFEISTIAMWDVPLAPGEIVALQSAGDSVYNENLGPEVDAGEFQEVELGEGGSVVVNLDATIVDDGAYSVLWEKIAGPNDIVFEDATLEDAQPIISSPGRYLLRVTADDGSLQEWDTVLVVVRPYNYGGLIMHWDFEETWNGKTIQDVSGNMNDGTLINGSGGLSSYTTGKYGNGLNLQNGDFSTEGDYASVDLVMPDNGSFAMWYNPRQLYNYHAVFDNSGNGDDWEMWIYSDSRIRFRVQSDSYVTANLNSLAEDGNCLNKWWHLAGTWERTDNQVEVKLYVNGLLAQTDTGAWVNPGSTFYLSGGNAGNDFGNGTYDDVRLYNRAISDEEVLSLVYLGNKPPLVTVPADQAAWLEENGQVTLALDGTVEDVDGSPLGKMTYLWSKVQGPNDYVIADASLEDTSVTISAPGTYTFMLYASDGQFDSSDTMSIDVYPYGYIGLVVHLPLDGDPNTIVGEVPSRLVDGANGSHEYVPGMLGQGLRLSGTQDPSDNDFVAVDYTYADRGTVSLWFKPEQIYNYNAILDNVVEANDWEMWIYSTGEFSARLQSGYLRGFWMEQDNWYHIVMTWRRNPEDPARVDEQLFINGELVAENLDNDWVDPGNQLYLGGGHPDQDDCNGILDDFRIYERPLTRAEIRVLASRSDFNEDMQIDLTDFSTFTGFWMQDAGECQSAPQGDYNADCKVDVMDLDQFVKFWLNIQ